MEQLLQGTLKHSHLRAENGLLNYSTKQLRSQVQGCGLDIDLELDVLTSADILTIAKMAFLEER